MHLLPGGDSGMTVIVEGSPLWNWDRNKSSSGHAPPPPVDDSLWLVVGERELLVELLLEKIKSRGGGVGY